MDEESPLPVSVTDDESDMEVHDSSNLKLKKLKKKGKSDSKDDQSTEIFRKKKTENTVIMSLVVFFHRMMAKKQLAIMVISSICGIYAVYIAFSRNLSIYGYESRHESAQKIRTILFVYGFVQLLLSIIFFCIYTTTTKIGEGKWCCQVLHFVACVVYLLVTFILLLVGIIGFYWVVKLHGYVEYEDRQSANYVDIQLYKSSLFIFSFHICIALLKCCCWNR